MIGFQNKVDSKNQDEISLVDILLFLKGGYKIIFFAVVAGLSIATTYLLVAPKKYEAVAQIAMAQMGSSNNGNLSPLGINIEEPALLIMRLSQPTSYPPLVLNACGLDGNFKLGASLVSSIKLSASKGAPNVVELRTFGASPEVAESCANSIFELIKVTQAQILAPYIDEAKIKLLDDELRLAKAKDLVAKADKAGTAMGATYLSTRDEIRYLLDEITALKNVVSSNQSRATRLIAPIYLENTPVAPKKVVSLALGFLVGLFVGLFVILGRQMWGKLKSNL